MIIAIPTRTEIVDLCEQTFIRGFTCINTRLGFDSKLLLPKNSDGKFRTKRKFENYKIGTDDKRVLSKISKMDKKKNKFRNAMTKPLPTSSIKRKKNPIMREFDLIMQGVSDEDKIGHLSVIDIHFDHKNASEKQLFLNEIFLPIFNKKKVLLTYERSVFQLLVAMRLNNNAKTHATIDEKIAIPLYSEYLYFLLAGCG